MKIYIYKEEDDTLPAEESARQTITINKNNGGMPTTLQASEVIFVTKEDLTELAKPKIKATATAVVTKAKEEKTD